MLGATVTSRVLELFTRPTAAGIEADWTSLVQQQRCSYLGGKCIKVRKSEPEVSIGTCMVAHGRELVPIIICPYRLLERRQIFFDCLHLLTLHQPGNQLHVVHEVRIPGGSVDYFLVSARNRDVVDFAGIELQTLDTTGTVWPERQRLLESFGLPTDVSDRGAARSFGMNWKMTAKTTLVQLHHKIETFEHLNKHLVLVLQDCLLDYIRREFLFDHVETARIGDPMHFHSYGVQSEATGPRLELVERLSTNSAGVAQMLGLQADATVAYREIVRLLESRLSDETLLTL